MRFVLFLLLIPFFGLSQSSDLVKVTQSGNQIYLSLNSTVTVIPNGSGSRVTYTNSNTFNIAEPLSYIRDTSCNLFIYGNIGTGSEILINKKWIDRVIKSPNNKASVIMNNGARYDLLQSYASMSSQLLEASGCGGSGGGDGLWTDHGDGISPSDLSHAVGIWNVNPIAPLDVTGSETMGIRIRNTSEIGVMEFGFDNGGGKLILRDENGVSVVQLTNDGASFINGGTLQLGNYGDGNYLADSLGKTESNYLSMYATDGTLIEIHKDSLLAQVDLNNFPSEELVTTGEEFVTRDSAITWQKVINQTRDSIWHTVDTYSKIGDLSVRNGRRILDNSTGIVYLTQAAAVPYFVTDGQYVVLLASGNYAVADLSSKREFQKYEEFKQLVPLLRLDGSTQEYKIGRENVVISATPYPVTNVNNSVYADTIVDGFWLDTVSVSLEGDNRVRYSHLGHNGGTGEQNAYIVSPSNAYHAANNDIGPGGKKSATAFTNSATVFVYMNNATIPASDTITFSFWGKTKQGLAASVRFDYNGAPGNKTIVMTDPAVWKRYEGWLINGVSGSLDNFTINPLTTAGDTLLIDDLQVEVGSSATAYKETFFRVKVSDKIYINRGLSLLKAGELELYKLYGYPTVVGVTSSDEREFLQAAIDYCDTGRRCNKILLENGNYNVDSTIVIPQNIYIDGVTPMTSGLTNPFSSVGGFTITVLSGFKGQDLFQVKPIGGFQAARGAGVSNCRVVLSDTVRCLFNYEEVNYSETKSLSVREESGGAFKIGLLVKVQNPTNSYINKFDNLNFINADSIGIEYNGSASNYFTRVDVTGSKVGVVINGGQHSWWQGLLTQSNDTCVIVRDGNVYFDDLYTEGGGNGIGGSVIKMTGGRVRIENSTLQVDDEATDTLLNLIGGRLDIENSNVRSSGSIRVGDDFNYLNIEETSFTDDPRLFFIGQDKNIRLRNCYNHNTGKDFVSNALITENERSYFIDNVISNSTLSDTVFLSDAIIKDNTENLIAHSDSILVINGAEISGGVDDVIIRHNTFTAPDGTQTAETISFAGDDIGGLSISIESNRAMLDRFDVGDDYVISFYLYSFTGKLMSFPFIFRAYNDADNNLTESPLTLVANQWNKVYVTGKIVDDTGSDLMTIRLNKPSSNIIIDDSIAVWRFSMQRGIFPSTSTRTTTVGIEAGDENPSITILEGDRLEFDGDVAMLSEIRDSTGSAGILGDVMTSTGDGWTWESAADVTDHGALTGLADDDHAQYALLAGRVGSQVLNGGTAANEDLTLNGTSNGTKTSSYVILQPSGGSVGIGTSAPLRLLDISAATPYARLTNTTNLSGTAWAGVEIAALEFYTADASSPSIVAIISAIGGAQSSGGFAYGDLAFSTKSSIGVVPERMRITNSGLVGIGTSSPDRLFHSEVSDVLTNTVGFANRFSHITSGTATTGFGIGTEIELENASNTNRIAGATEYTWVDATDATEDSKRTEKLMSGGTLTTLFTMDSDGSYKFGSSANGSEIYPYAGANPTTPSTSGTNLSFYNYNTTETNQKSFAFSGSDLTPTSGITGNIWAARAFAPTSGTAVYADLLISSTINQTGGASGTTHGILITPTLTAADNYTGIKSDATVQWNGGVINSSHATPSAFAAQQNDWTPSGGDLVTTFRISLTGDQTLTGMDLSNVTGRHVRLTNVDANDEVLTINHEDASSTDANRFHLINDLDMAIKEGESMSFEYDGTISRWRPVAVTIASTPINREYNFRSRAGASGVYYLAGYYQSPAADANLTNAGTTVTHGTANVSYAAHAFAVAAAAGTTNGSTLVLTVTGTSITDAGTRTPADSEVLVASATTATTNQYFETTKKWLGTVTYTLSSSGGTVFAFDFNYGFAKYDDVGGRDFTITDFEAVGLCNTSDSGFNVELMKHTDTGWTYSAAAFIPGNSSIASMNTDHSTEQDVNAGDHFAYKRGGLTSQINGAGNEGYVVRVTTSVNNSIEYMNVSVTSDIPLKF